MNLANKYRPKTFDEVVEQGVVVQVLKNMCETENLPNRNFLLIGSAGTGKTSLAKIAGRVLNSNDLNIIEMDAASHSGVDDIREIINQALQYPIGSKWKIFIIDECHALSDKAWQALLKTLEDSPAKSIFFLCTTNPEKIPPTIISRVQVFRLSKISTKGIIDRIKYILDQENSDDNITYTDEAVSFIAKLANGGMRDALTLTDKALAYSKNLTIENLQIALNLPNYDDYFDLLNAYAKHENEKITEIVDKVYNSGVNFTRWFEEFHSFVINIVKFIFSRDIKMTTIPSTYNDKIANYGVSHSIICLKLCNKLRDLIPILKQTNFLQETALSYLYYIPQK